MFHPLTYEGIDLTSVVDARRRAAFELQIDEFGQTPRRLFSTHHPPRDDTSAGRSCYQPPVKKPSRREAGADVGRRPLSWPAPTPVVKPAPPPAPSSGRRRRFYQKRRPLP